MKKIITFNDISNELGVFQQTITNFCRDFDIDFGEQFIGWGWVSDSKIKTEFIEYLIEIRQFIRIYNQDNYEAKTIKSISSKIKRPYKEIESYLKSNFPKDFTNGEFYFNEQSSQRYISSFAIDYKLGGNYNFIKYTQTKNINFEIIETIFKNQEFKIAYGNKGIKKCIGMCWINNKINQENNLKNQEWFILHSEIKKEFLKSILNNKSTEFESLINVLKLESLK
jgi:hypothetical protein